MEAHVFVTLRAQPSEEAEKTLVFCSNEGPIPSRGTTGDLFPSSSNSGWLCPSCVLAMYSHFHIHLESHGFTEISEVWGGSVMLGNERCGLLFKDRRLGFSVLLQLLIFHLIIHEL